MTLYVGDLGSAFTDVHLQALFAPLGAVQSAKMIRDQAAGNTRGFGFVEMSDADAKQAMQVARVAVPPVIEKRNAIPWLFSTFFALLFFWLLKNDIGFAFGILVSASTVIAAIETAYAGMYWCTAAFTVVAMIFNPYVRVLPPLHPAIAALAMVALSPMLLLFVCRKVGPYTRRLPDGSRWWLPAARAVVDLLE